MSEQARNICEQCGGITDAGVQQVIALMHTLGYPNTRRCPGHPKLAPVHDDMLKSSQGELLVRSRAALVTCNEMLKRQNPSIIMMNVDVLLDDLARSIDEQRSKDE